MTTLIFDWSDWDGPASGHVIVTRRTWRRAPESLHVPWQVVVPVDGRATLDVAHVAGEAVSIRWAPRGAASRTDHVLIPDSGEHLAHLLDRVDPSTLEPLPEDLPSAVDLVARAEALVARIESGEFTGAAGTDGRGVASITAEGETATVRYTDGSVSTLPLPRGPEGAPGRDGVDGAPGADGRDGQDGHTPSLSWQGSALAVDGVPGPDLRGPAGKDGEDGEDGAPGPAPSIKIGTVSSGTTPSATIKGTSPDLTLDLVFAKGDRGDRGETGPPGVVSSASAYVIIGPGRPDVPSTTAGTITGAEPVGAEYRSTDGANVGAWTWRKRPTGWVVTDGDTGWRKIARTDSWTDSNAYYLVRRTNAGVTFITSVKNVTGSIVTWPDVWAWSLAAFAGFRPTPRGPLQGVGLTMRVGDSAATINSDTTRWTTPQHAPAGQTLAAHVFVQSDDPWPSAPLPGSPA